MTTSADALLICETTDGVATLTLNRPGQFNALSSALIDEMQSMLIRAATDPCSQRAGAGSAPGTTSRRSGPWPMWRRWRRCSRAAAA